MAQNSNDSMIASKSMKSDPLFDLDLDTFDDLDITTERIDFEDVGDDLAEFQQDEILKKVLSEVSRYPLGIDLRHYARQIEQDLYTAEEDSINQYLAEAEELAKLHFNLKNSEATLEQMQTMLGSFQTHLGSLSSEIKGLQSDTLSLNVKLANRKEVDIALTDIVSNLDLSPGLVSQISEGDMDESYIAPLRIFSEKLNFAFRHKSYVCTKEVATMMERLKAQASSKIRDHFMAQFMVLTVPRPQLNLKQLQLCERHYLFEFCAQHVPDISSELRHSYVHLLGLEYQSNMVTYLGSVMKLQTSDELSRDELMGVSEVRAAGFFSIGKRDTDEISRNFLLGARDHFLHNIDSDPINPVQSHDHGITLAFEVVFRSAIRLLMDFALPENRFVMQFFNSQGLFNQVLKRAFEALVEPLDQWLSVTGDLLGVLLFIRSVNLLQATMQRVRRNGLQLNVPHFDILMVCLCQNAWPKFQVMLDTHLASFSSAKYSTDSKASLKAHYVTVRYASFVTAVRAVSRVTVVVDPVVLASTPVPASTSSAAVVPPITRATSLSISSASSINVMDPSTAVASATSLERPAVEEAMSRTLVRFRRELDALMARIITSISAPKRQAVFLINNYDYILCSLREHGVTVCDEITYFAAAMEKYLAAFVEEELVEKFGRLMSFIRATETAYGLQRSGGVDGDIVSAVVDEDDEKPSLLVRAEAKLEPAVVESIVRGFISSWQDALQQGVASVLQGFGSSGQNGIENARSQVTVQMVTRRLLGQFLAYYVRFDRLVRKYDSGGNQVQTQ